MDTVFPKVVSHQAQLTQSQQSTQLLDMAMINGNRRRQQVGLVAAGAVGARAVVDSIMANRQLVNALSNRLANGLRSGPERGGKQSKKKRGGSAAKQAGNPGATGMMLYKSVGGGGVGKLRITDKFLDNTITNTSANQFCTATSLSMSTFTGATIGCIGTLSTKLAAVKTLYRHFRVNKLKITWIPSVTEQVATGNFMLRVDSDPSNETNVTTPTRYLAADTHVFTPINKGASCVWTPRELKEKEEKYTQALGASGHTADEMSFGVIQFYAPNNLAISTPIGYVAYEIDVTFSNPNS